MSTAMAYHEHFTRVDTRLHRATVCGRDTCNGTCEQACGCLCCPTAGDLDIHPHQWDGSQDRKDEPSSKVGMWLGALTVLLVAAGGALVLVMQGAPK